MQEKDFNLITKYLSEETSSEEKKLIDEKLLSDKHYKKNFDEIKNLWDSLSMSNQSFDKERILKLIKFKISQHKKQKKNRVLYASLKYAAVFIGLLVISISVYKDLNDIKIIVNNSNTIEKVVLPDNTTVILNKNAEIEYQNSTIKGFKRTVKLTGEAFFKVTKKDNRKFVVKTNEYDITVLGTEFNVRTYKNDNSVVLRKGKVLLNNFKIIDNEIVMKPGEIVKYSLENNTFIQEKINPKIYTSWMKKRLEFDNFSLTELAELIKLRYNKTLIINNEDTRNKNISGSAPSDDVHLIVKAMQSIFNTEILEKNDTIIIN